MIRISAITRVGLVAVACAAVAAPSALAKPPVKSLYGYAMSYTPSKATPKKAATVQSVPYRVRDVLHADEGDSEAGQARGPAGGHPVRRPRDL